MSAHAGKMLLAGIAGALCTSGVARAEPPMPEPPRAAGREPTDVGLEDIRKATEEMRRERDQILARVRELRAKRAPAQRVGIRIANRPVTPILVQQVEAFLNDRDAGAFPEAVIVERTFNVLLFGHEGDDTLRERLDDRLETNVRRVGRELRLSTASERKLQLAGRGDIKRLYDRVEECRKEYAVVRLDPVSLERFLPRLNSLRNAIAANPFGEASLFAKTLRKIQKDELVQDDSSQ